MVGILAFSVSLAVLVPALASAQATYVYRQTTGSRVDRIDISQDTGPGGEVIGVAATSGETYRVEIDPGGGTTLCRFDYPGDRTSWVARRNGPLLRLEGTVQGRAAARTFSIDSHPWYECVERSLQELARSGSGKPELFWMIEPYGGGAYLMTGRIERHERVQVDGRFVDAVRVVVRPAGLLWFIWSSTYWYSPLDGTFLRSESIRNILPVVPLTVVELVEDRRAAR